jgi:hypothetical protein
MILYKSISYFTPPTPVVHLVSTVKPKAKDSILTGALLMFYILQKIAFNIVAYFSIIYYHM